MRETKEREGTTEGIGGIHSREKKRTRDRDDAMPTPIHQSRDRHQSMKPQKTTEPGSKPISAAARREGRSDNDLYTDIYHTKSAQSSLSQYQNSYETIMDVPSIMDKELDSSTMRFLP